MIVKRTNGADGIIACKYQVIESESHPQNSAKEYEDFVPIKGDVVFAHGETERIIEVEILPKDNDESDRDDVFDIKIFEPTGGAKISKRDICFINIVGNDELENRVDDIEHILEMMQKNKKGGWCSQFKEACMLAPSIDEDGNLDDITGIEAFVHFCSIGWKVFFALVPPAKYCKGKLSFVFSLAMIGFVTAIVGEFASLFGCVIGMKPGVTAISFVALGTSLPDTFASKQAA